MKTKTFFLAILICSITTSFTQIIHVPANQPTIQSGIDAAVDGDTVLVANGTYLENINFNGKALVLASQFIFDADTNHINNTIIDGSQPANPDYGSVITLNNDEDTSSVIIGFTITGGTGLIVEEFDMKLGGGIACNSSGAKILNNKIINNEIIFSGYAGGGGIGCVSEDEENWLVVKDNIIIDNVCISDGIEALGGGIFSGANLIVENNKIFANTCTGTNTAEANGGGIVLGSQSNYLAFNVSNNLIHNNICEGNTVAGAGVLLWYSEGIISGNEFWNNYGDAVISAQGGGLCLISPIGAADVIYNDFFANNLNGQNVQGGGFQVSLSNNVLNIDNNSFRQNILTASNGATGGGLIIIENSNNVTVENNQIEGNTIEGNEFSPGAGLAVANPYANIAIVNNLFSENNGTGSGEGGGMYLYNANEVFFEINGNIFENNSMNNGGGLSTFNSFNFVLSNNLFTSNSATESGGGCKFKYYGSNYNKKEVILKKGVNLVVPYKTKADLPLLINNTFVNNEANLGGAFYSDHQDEVPEIINSIFWDNEATSGNDVYYTGTDSLLISYCNIDPTYNTGIYGKWKGIENINEDPLFMGYGDFPFSLQDDSPCVNTGTPDTTGLNLPIFDLAGNPRLYGGNIEMGAYENQNVIISKVESFSKFNFELNVFPNPVFDNATIKFTIPGKRLVTISVHDISGKQKTKIISTELSSGTYQINWNVEGLMVGIYFLRLEANGVSETIRVAKL